MTDTPEEPDRGDEIIKQMKSLNDTMYLILITLTLGVGCFIGRGVLL